MTTPRVLGWWRDPAASGWRSRAWPDEGGELVAYDTGDWFVCVPGRYQAAASGKEATHDEAQTRTIAVYTALTGKTPTGAYGKKDR